MSENNKHPSAGRGRKRAGWFRRLFFGGSKTLADDMLETDRYGQQKIEDVEVILSPGKQIVKGFLEKKYAVVALVVVVVMFLIAFVGPLFMPKYFDAYSENTQQSIYPTLSMMKMPKELQKDVKQVSSYGPFTVGLSGSGKVYVWGCTQIGTTGFDVSRIPEDVQKANIVMVAAGIDHIIAIDDKGKPGSGKSFSAKREILSCFLITKDDIIICDPEGEYFALVAALHGQVVKLATNSKDYLNPMDIQLSHKGDKEALKLKSDFIITLCDLIAGGKDGLENDEKGIIDECIRHIYDKYFENPVPENMPILEDLYNALLKHKNPKAERIANSLVLYVHGSQNYFNHHTNVDSGNRIMCFDIRDLGKQLKELGMLIVQDAVWNRVSQNRERKIATRYYCDEFHLLLKEKQTAIYSVEIWKRFRKWGGIPTGLTQNVGDFLRSEEIEGILGNSDFVYLLNQNAKDQAILADKLGLSDKQLSYVTNSEPGSGLILFDNVVIPFVDKYPTDTKTYRIMNTKPEESVQKEDAV